mmetsp:Transcript_53870/g.153475  ORF Transcript_53870/g.153475 Transcript_53870/m.153475 type:complete len:218 (+) Transcript_53870:1288-1941(+)
MLASASPRRAPRQRPPGPLSASVSCSRPMSVSSGPSLASVGMSSSSLLDVTSSFWGVDPLLKRSGEGPVAKQAACPALQPCPPCQCPCPCPCPCLLPLPHGDTARRLCSASTAWARAAVWCTFSTALLPRICREWAMCARSPSCSSLARLAMCALMTPRASHCLSCQAELSFFPRFAMRATPRRRFESAMGSNWCSRLTLSLAMASEKFGVLASMTA